MKKPGVPSNESKRLEVLQSLGILDTRAEECFDRLTRIAKQAFDLPVVLVTLVDEERLWFKSSVGINVDITETSRETSFCAHTILDDELFIINNASKDPRFSDNPFVLGKPNIKFYAGCPLIVSGYRLGTLCLIDHKERIFSEEDIAMLKDLALMVERELAMVELAIIDELTGVSNRRGFMALAQHCLNFSIRNQFPVTLIYMDLDDFKFINDNFGEVQGDKVLNAFTMMIKSSFRSSDVIARLEGDKFVLLLNSTSKKAAEKIISKLKQALERYNLQGECAHDVEFSYAIVEFDVQKHIAIEALLSEASMLMYALKNLKNLKK